MQLLIVHHHLNRGGVTRVIENHLRALAAAAPTLPERVVIAHGGRTEGWNASVESDVPFPVVLSAVAELEYDNLRNAGPADVGEAVRRVLKAQQFSPESAVVHVHNHSLGKNASLCPAVRELAAAGWRLLLQIHDFAEDLRPANYRYLREAAGADDALQSQLYPQGSHVHYATLNRRDFDILARAGVDPVRRHALPNPVGAAQTPTAAERAAAREKLAAQHGVGPQTKYVLYPVRGIRRKNLGELLLWSLLFDDTVFGVTLAPLNPDEQPSYQRWHELAMELKLPVLFDCGAEMMLDENFAAADAIITTSVAEGFGMVYLEAPLRGRPLVGRSLPGISDDFRTAGMEFPGLGERMQVPAAWIDLASLRDKHLSLGQSLLEAYGMEFDSAQLREQVELRLSGESIDFGVLDWSAQADVLRGLAAEPQRCEELRSLNPHVAVLDGGSGDPTRETNLRAIEQHFSFSVIGDRLASIYNHVLQSPCQLRPPGPEIGRAILNDFVVSNELHPIRLES